MVINMLIATEKNFEDIYNILKEAFPPCERRTKSEQKALFSLKEYKVFVDTETPDVFMAIWDFEEFLFLEHFAVKKEKRGNAVGSSFFNEFISTVNKTIIFEVEPPENEISVRRIKFYTSLGAKLNDFNYIQPSLQKNQPSIPLRIMSYPVQLTNKQFTSYRNTVLRKVYNINNF